MKKILMVYEPKNDKIQELSGIIKEELKHYDWQVVFKSPSDAHSPAHYMGILILGPENLQISECQTLGWIKKYGKILTQKSCAFISLGSDFVESGPSHLLIPRKKIVADTLGAIHCAPRMIELFSERSSDVDVRRFTTRFAEYVLTHTNKKAA